MKHTFTHTMSRISACLLAVTAHAGVLVTTSINLTHLQVAPGFGSFQVQPPFTAGANVQASDSLGGSSSQFNNVDDSSTSASAATALANASAAASVPALTANASSGVHIGLLASASSSAQGALGPAFGVGQGFFEIFDSLTPGANPVSVTFKATLNINQFLHTDAFGITASSETIFQLILPDLPNQPLLFFDNPMTIGSSNTASFASSPTLTGTVTLNTNTPYTLIAEVDSESSGLNSVPEPSLVLIDALGLVALCIFFRRRKQTAA